MSIEYSDSGREKMTMSDVCDLAHKIIEKHKADTLDGGACWKSGLENDRDLLYLKQCWEDTGCYEYELHVQQPSGDQYYYKFGFIDSEGASVSDYIELCYDASETIVDFEDEALDDIVVFLQAYSGELQKDTTTDAEFRAIVSRYALQSALARDDESMPDFSRIQGMSSKACEYETLQQILAAQLGAEGIKSSSLLGDNVVELRFSPWEDVNTKTIVDFAKNPERYLRLWPDTGKTI